MFGLSVDKQPAQKLPKSQLVLGFLKVEYLMVQNSVLAPGVWLSCSDIFFLGLRQCGGLGLVGVIGDSPLRGLRHEPWKTF